MFVKRLCLEIRSRFGGVKFCAVAIEFEVMRAERGVLQ